MNDEQDIKLSDEDANQFIAIYSLILTVRDNYNNVWNDFEKQIIEHNRFFPKSEVIDKIHEYKEKATTVIPCESIFYRARIFTENPNVKFIEKYKSILSENGLNFNDLDIEMSGEIFDTAISMLQFVDESKATDDIKLQLEALRRYKKSNFKGYNATESLPPKENNLAGRGNPDHIRYLYLSEDNTTPIYEVKPTIGQHISIAKLKSLRELKLYDFTIASDDPLELNLFNIISEKFSMPNYGETTKYLPTQYLAELIKSMNFDGIRFKSSLNNGGYNVMLFNVDDCKVLSSELVTVKNINIETETPSIYNEFKKTKQ